MVKKNKEAKPSKKTYMEPVLNDNDAKWLMVTKEEVYPVIPGRSVKNTIEDPFPPEIKIVFETKPAGLWQCKKCGAADIQSNEKPLFCPSCNRESSFEIITKRIDPDIWKLPIWKDIPVDDLDMLNTYLDMLALTKQCIVFPEEMQYKLFTLWIISMYKIECWDAVPFLIFRGLIETGKTRALEIIRELGFRAIHSAGLSSKAMFRFTDEFKANVLIDEIDNKIDRRTESGREMIDFLKPSYRRGSFYYTANREDQRKIEKYSNFGFKAFAGEKGGYDDAIFSRAIDFQMEQDYPEITELKEIKDEANRIKTILLNYRFKTNNSPELPEDFPFKGRTREIYSCIIRTAMHIGMEYNDIIDYIKNTEEEKQEELENSDEYSVLKVMRNYECQPTLDDAPGVISYADIAEALGWEDKQRQKLGYIFKKKLILKTKRRNTGSVVLLNDPKNERKLKQLYKRFKL